MKLGHVTVGGLDFEIIRLWLEHGEVKVQFSVHGPVGPLQGAITVYGADGRGCWQGKVWDMPRVPAGSLWTCTYGVRIAEIYGSNEGEKLDVRYL